MDYYDGNYWDHVRTVYDPIYAILSQQKLDSLIRKILSYYSEGDTRYINFVIRQAITPEFYLSDFISFAFDIYESTFKYELMENMTEPLVNIFLDLSKEYKNTNGDFGTKDNTYKLIKTTKEIINNVNWFGELIAYTTVVLKYIDSFYWNDINHDLPYSDFFENEIQKWIESHNALFFGDRKRQSSERTTNWTASYSLNGTNVYLRIPNHLIRTSYDPRSIKLKVYSENEMVSRFDYPSIKLVLGGYQLSSFNIKLTNPLKKIRYELLSDDEVIFSSNESLYRDYLIFNEKHKELKAGTKYVGNIDVVTGIDAKCEKVETYYSTEDYKLGNIFIEKYETFIIDNETVYFTVLEKSRVIGKKLDRTYIRTKNQIHPLYTTVNELQLVTDVESSNLKLQINEKNYHINEEDAVAFNDSYVYSVNIEPLLADGFNYVKVSDIQDSDTIFSTLLFVDSSYSSDYRIDNDSNVVISISSVFGSFDNLYCDLTKDNPFEFEFNSEFFGYPLYLIPDMRIACYRIDDEAWRLFSESLSVKELQIYSKIYFYGITYDEIKLIEQNSHTEIDIPVYKVAEKEYITVEKIRQFTGDQFARMQLSFLDNGIINESIQVYYKVVIDQRSLGVKYDDDLNECRLYFEYYGKDDIHIELFESENGIFEYVTNDNPVSIQINNDEFFKKYKMIISCGEDDLFSLNNNKYTIFENHVTFYSKKTLPGTEFQIFEGWVEFYNLRRREWAERFVTVKSNTASIYIKNHVEDDIFDAVITVDGSLGKNSLDVQLELTGEISEGRFSGSLTSEGDLLLFSNHYKEILIDESHADKTDMPISEYIFAYQIDEELIKGVKEEHKRRNRQEFTSTVTKSSSNNNPKKSVLDTDISTIQWNKRTYNCLHRAGIQTLRDIVNMSEKDLLRVRNLGKRSCNEIIEYVRSIGYDIRSE